MTEFSWLTQSNTIQWTCGLDLFDWVQLVRKSNSHIVWCSIWFDYQTQSHSTANWIRLGSIAFDFRTFDWLCRKLQIVEINEDWNLTPEISAWVMIVLGMLCKFVSKLRGFLEVSLRNFICKLFACIFSEWCHIKPVITQTETYHFFALARKSILAIKSDSQQLQEYSPLVSHWTSKTSTWSNVLRNLRTGRHSTIFYSWGVLIRKYWY